jgi:hypothetical protein
MRWIERYRTCAEHWRVEAEPDIYIFNAKMTEPGMLGFVATANCECPSCENAKRSCAHRHIFCLGHNCALGVSNHLNLPIFSSPILPIEIKRISDRYNPLEAAVQLRQFLLSTGAGVGMLVDLKEPIEPLKKTLQPLGPPPFVFPISVVHLKQILENGEFVHVLIESRNRAVHGA